MEPYKDYLIEAWALGEDDHWEPRFAIHSADGKPAETPIAKILLVHEKTRALAIERAVATAKTYIDEEM